MQKKAAVILYLISILAIDAFAVPPHGDVIKSDVVTISVRQQYDKVRPGGKSALAVHFELKKDWHFYASAKTAPGGMNLKVKPSFPGYIDFSEPIFPKPHLYFDKSLGKNLEVFSGKFTVFLPFTISEDVPKTKGTLNTLVTIKTEGAVCSDVQCRVPDFGDLGIVIKIVPDAVMAEPKFVLPAGQPTETATFEPGISSLWSALLLAFLAGLALNIMPCVWPILPVIVLRLVEQAKLSKAKSAAMGLVFCLGILLFFACLAGANIILQIFYGTLWQWGDQFRSPVFVTVMALLLVVLALFMFGVFTITVPSAVSAKAGSGQGYAGALGMGFLAAILSTPCSFAILAAAFAWAQAQPLLLGTFAIMVIGLGMAAPYAVLVSLPGLLARLPRPGKWMEIFKQAVGFILLFVAIWLIAALPQQRRTGVLYFALAVSFCIWMWAGWVDYSTKLSRKLIIRIIAAALAVAAGLYFLTPPTKLIDWQEYDAGLIETSLKEQRPVLIDFTADWCMSCKFIDKVVYSRKDIAELIKQKSVLAVKADTTIRDNPATLALKDVYKEPGVPVSILFLPGEKEPVRWRGKAFADELKNALENIER